MSRAALPLLLCSSFSLPRSASCRISFSSLRPRTRSTCCFNPIMATLSPVKKVLVPIANGTEEMEAVIVIDILRRAGADVTVASVEEGPQVLAFLGVKLVADTLIGDCESYLYDLIVLPGGIVGAEHLRDNAVLRRMTQAQAQQERLYAAVCAAPAVVLEPWGLLKGKQATCYPSFVSKLSNSESADRRVVNDGLVTTTRGPATTMEFSLKLVELLFGKEKCAEVANPLVLRDEGNRKPTKQEYNPLKLSSDGTAQGFRVLVPVANGSEEMEVVIIVDVLRRAGFEVVLASVEKDLQIVASRKVKILADTFIDDLVTSKFDMGILPGGMPGAQRLGDSEPLINIFHELVKENKIIGAICAAPAVVFEAKGFLKGRKATCHPSFGAKLSDQTAVDARVVIDGHLITSRGPGTATEFAVSIVEHILGLEKASQVAQDLLLPYP